MVDHRSDDMAADTAPSARRGRHGLLWLSALLVFALGCYIGWNINANLGAALWGLSAVLGFIPFLSHRFDDV
ncbi:MAG: hypothetical protein AAGD35_13385 [Actinomycetota bacterium]